MLALGTVPVISFDAPETCTVNLEVLDSAGRHLRTLVDGSVLPRIHEYWWNFTDDEGREVSERGEFMVRLTARGDVQTGWFFSEFLIISCKLFSDPLPPPFPENFPWTSSVSHYPSDTWPFDE